MLIVCYLRRIREARSKPPVALHRSLSHRFKCNQLPLSVRRLHCNVYLKRPAPVAVLFLALPAQIHLALPPPVYYTVFSTPISCPLHSPNLSFSIHHHVPHLRSFISNFRYPPTRTPAFPSAFPYTSKTPIPHIFSPSPASLRNAKDRIRSQHG